MTRSLAAAVKMGVALSKMGGPKPSAEQIDPQEGEASEPQEALPAPALVRMGPRRILGQIIRRLGRPLARPIMFRLDVLVRNALAADRRQQAIERMEPALFGGAASPDPGDDHLSFTLAVLQAKLDQLLQFPVAPLRRSIVVVGGGGHAAVIIEALRAGEEFNPVAVVDPSPNAAPVLGVPVAGGDEALPGLLEQGVTAAVIAIGDNRLRQALGRAAQARGFTLPPVIHPTALVSPSAFVGEGVVIMAGARVGARARLEQLAIVNTSAVVEHDDRIGPASHVAPGVALGGGVQVGERALVGIGSAARPGSRIGDDAVVGAGSAIAGDIPAGATVGGTPARRLSPSEKTP
jgi:UDP-perosamine 4-acetyltransferase